MGGGGGGGGRHNKFDAVSRDGGPTGDGGPTITIRRGGYSFGHVERGHNMF